MSAYLSYEQYLTKPEEHITPQRIANLMKIIKAIHEHGNPALSIRQIRDLTNLQNSQVNIAMTQRGMKVLFAGKGPAFTLSEAGLEVIAGTREVTLLGLTNPFKPKVAFPSNLSPVMLTRKEYQALDEKTVESLKKQNIRFVKMITHYYADTLASCPDDETRILLKRSFMYQLNKTFDQLIAGKVPQTDEPVAS